MTALSTSEERCGQKVVVGSEHNFWTWSEEMGWDLTHPPKPSSDTVVPCLRLACEVSNILIDPVKSALVIIDMQNFSLSKRLQPNLPQAMYKAHDALLKHAIPAARERNIQIIWLTWGLTEADLQDMPPGPLRTFGWRANSDAADYGMSLRESNATGPEHFVRCGESPRLYGLGDDLGTLSSHLDNNDTDGGPIEAGRVLMRGTWNAALHKPFADSYKQGQSALRPDVLIYKNRNSGMSDAQPDLRRFLEASGIRTLLFAGMNTDQCVMSTLKDANSRGYDTIMLKDGCVTDSPHYAQQAAEFNCCRSFGFLSSCEALAEADVLK